VELARALIEGRPVAPSAALSAEHRLTARYALDLAHTGTGSWTPELVAQTTRTDRRTLGLLAILLEQADLAVRAWQDVSIGYPVDPLADGALGMLHLARGEWELAYPRLLAAYTAFPEAGFLCSRLAEASLHTGKLEQTEQLLERAATLERHDTFESLLRVRAGLLAEQGKDEEARALYEGLVQRRRGLSPFLDYAHFLESRCEIELALDVRRRYAELQPNSVLAQAQFLAAAERWWSCAGERAWDRLERLFLATDEFGFFFSALPSLLSSDRRCRTLDPHDTYVLPDFVLPPGAASSSTTDEGTSLLELVRRMETLEVDTTRLFRLPAPVRSLFVRSLCSPWPWPSRALWGAIVGLGLCSPASANPQVLSEQKISETAGGFGGVLDTVDVFGTSVAALADLDGNGVGDLAVGAYRDDDGGTDQGAVWILFLNADGTVASERKISETAGGFGGVLDPGDAFGISVAALGDLDGDGVGDLAVGASDDDDGGTDQGTVWILFLNADGTVAREQLISEGTGGFGGSLDAFDYFGADVAAFGDMNGDGVGDLAVGASGDDDGGTDQGAVWILFLNANGTVASAQKISETAGGFGGILDPDDRFSVSVAALGDLDGDGVGDLAVGALLDDDGGTDQGAVWILFLNANGTVASAQKISETAGGFRGDLDPGDGFGTSVAALGDLDGDGVGDLAVGSYLDDDGGTDQGAVWILFLNANGTVASAQKISETAGGFGGILDPDDRFGVSVAALGDLDGDGLGDLAVGAYLDDDGDTAQGAVWILFRDCEISAAVTTRNAGLNPMSYSATPAILGSTVTATVDLTTTGHAFARLLRSDFPVQRTLSSGYVVLVGGPRIVRVTGFPGSLTTGVPGPLATFQIPIPNVTALCGRRFYTQAVHFGGGLPFALSNSQDFVLGR
jgi:tetratricopeptide (TPR) repeat protein